MRIAFLGTPEPAAVALRSLVAAGHDVAIVITRVDKRRGRNEAPRPTPVKAAALSLGLPVSQRVEDCLEVGAALGVVVAFGRIIKPDVLAGLDMVNVHFSLLPRWRGAAPVERAILAGDAETGVCLMAIDEGLDTGPVYRCEKLPIGPEESASQLRARLSTVGADLLVQTLEEGLGSPIPQDGEATYADKVEVDELRLEWTRPVEALHRMVRVGRAWTTWRGRRLLVHEARAEESGAVLLAPGEVGWRDGGLAGVAVGAGDGLLRLVRVQPEGRAAMSAADWVRGARPAAGDRLGS